MDERHKARARRSSGLARCVRRGLLLGAVIALAGFAACDGDPCEGGVCVDDSGMRLLDRVCDDALSEGPACEVEGDAQQTSAVTEDTTGFRLGEGSGTLTIHLAALDPATRSAGRFSVEVLAVAREPGTEARLEANLSWGSCGAGCPADPFPSVVEIDDEYAWVTVIADQDVATVDLPYDAVLTLSGAGIDIVDLRSLAVYPEYGCSIAGPVGAGLR